MHRRPHRSTPTKASARPRRSAGARGGGDRSKAVAARAGVALHAPAEVSEREARLATHLVCVLALVLVTALLVVALGPHRIGDYSTETDFYGGYAQGARLIQHGRIIPTRYGVVGPGYEAALALVGLIVRNLFTAAELISIVSALAVVLLWF